MRALAAWIMARRMNGLVATSGFAAMGFALPPLLIISLASLGLVTLRKGAREGLLVMAGCVILFVSMALITTQSVRADLMILVVLWLMTWALALVYRTMATPAWMINSVGLVGMAGVVGFYLAVADPAAFWLVLLEQHIKPVFVEQQLLASNEELDLLLSMLASVMTGGVAALVSVVLITSLLLARWWQAILYNPGGFRQEYYAMRLGKGTAVVLIVLLLITLTARFAITTDMATVIWLLYFFQGMAVIHSLIGMTGLSIGWLVSLYLLIIVMPNYASPVISGLGLVDTWFDFRRRLPRRRKPDEDE
jgi:hypothetical protein